MKTILQQNGQTLIDIALQEYGTIQGLEQILLSNPNLYLHCENEKIKIIPKIYNNRSSGILSLFQSENIEIVAKVHEVQDVNNSNELIQFSEQFSDQFY